MPGLLWGIASSAAVGMNARPILPRCTGVS